MSDLQVELLTELAPARRQAILSRSQVDVSAVLEVVAPILSRPARSTATPNPCGSISSSRPTSLRQTF